MSNVIPRSEYPRPDFVREKWQNLNGEWEFYNDLSASGRDRKIYEDAHFDGKIIVPFCPESKLSGVEYVDFMTSVRQKHPRDRGGAEGKSTHSFRCVRLSCKSVRKRKAGGSP